MSKKKRGYQQQEEVVSKRHAPKKDRPHVAQEFRENGQTELAEEAAQKMMPHLRGRVQGLA